MIVLEAVEKDYHLNRKQQKERQETRTVVKAVDRLSLICQPGRIFSLLGPNGAGKTTTLRMIATILTPTAGRISVCGHDTQEAGRRVRSKIGFLTGSTGLYTRLTPKEIVDYFAKLHGLSKNASEERRDHLFSILGIHDFAGKRVGQLSTGMRQRVSIARTLIHDPEVIIFDEPTSGLDVISAESIINLIRSSKEAGKTIIFSSHIMSEVDLLCDDLAIIHRGKICYSSTMEEFRAQMEESSLTKEFIRVISEADREQAAEGS